MNLIMIDLLYFELFRSLTRWINCFVCRMKPLVKSKVRLNLNFGLRVTHDSILKIKPGVCLLQ